MKSSVYSYPDGSRYEGQWLNGRRHGHGAWSKPDGTIYVGEWENDKPQGQGTLTLPNGRKHKGEWKAGKRHGSGIEIHPDGTKQYGEWEDGVFVEAGNLGVENERLALGFSEVKKEPDFQPQNKQYGSTILKHYSKERPRKRSLIWSGLIIVTIIISLIVVVFYLTGGDEAGISGPELNTRVVDYSYFRPTSPNQNITDPETGFEIVAGELVIVAEIGVDQDEIVRGLVIINGTIVGGIEKLGIYQVEIPGKTYEAANSAAEKIKSLNTIQAAFPNYVLVTLNTEQTIPDVPQWLEKDNEKRWGQEYIDLPRAWSITKGSPSLKVGVIDKGFDQRHPDLQHLKLRMVELEWYRKAAYWIGWQSRMASHGNAVASIIGAAAYNQKGMAGIVWDLELYGYTCNSLCDFVELLKMAHQDGVSVVNVSLGGRWSQKGEVDFDELQETNKALERILDDLDGILLVVGAGNNPNVPAEQMILASLATTRDDVITVGAIDSKGNRNEQFSYGEGVSVAAPGTNIWAAQSRTFLDYIHPSSWLLGEPIIYDYSSGTSFAAPFVTGVAALIWSVNPELSPAQVKEIIISTADPHDFDRPLGSGVVNASRALEKATSKEYIKDPGQDLENEAGRSPAGVVNKYFMELQSNNVKGAFALFDPYILKEHNLIGQMDEIIESFSLVIKEQPLINHDIVDVMMLNDNLALVEVAGTVQYLGKNEKRTIFTSLIKRDLIWNINPGEFVTQYYDKAEMIYTVAVDEGNNLFIRRKPGSKNKPSDDIIERVPRGQKLEVLNRHGNYIVIDDYTWWEVKNTTTGLKGWVAAEYLEILHTIAADEVPTERESYISTHTIVGLFPLSSPLSTFGENSLEAAKLAAADVNRWLEAEDKKWRLKLEYDDTASDGQVGLFKVKSWHGEGVKFFAGPMTSGLALEILPYANANQILFISPSSTHPDLAIEDDCMFRFCYDESIDTIQPPVLGDQSYREHVRNHIISIFGREPDEEFAYNTYDIIWAFSLSIDRVGYNPQLVRTVLPNIVKEWSSKYGASGLIVLNKAGDRVLTY